MKATIEQYGDFLWNFRGGVKSEGIRLLKAFSSIARAGNPQGNFKPFVQFRNEHIFTTSTTELVEIKGAVNSEENHENEGDEEEIVAPTLTSDSAEKDGGISLTELDNKGSAPYNIYKSFLPAISGSGWGFFRFYSAAKINEQEPYSPVSNYFACMAYANHIVSGPQDWYREREGNILCIDALLGTFKHGLHSLIYPGEVIGKNFDFFTEKALKGSEEVTGGVLLWGLALIATTAAVAVVTLTFSLLVEASALLINFSLGAKQDLQNLQSYWNSRHSTPTELA
jgi:hypothetical protein